MLKAAICFLNYVWSLVSKRIFLIFKAPTRDEYQVSSTSTSLGAVFAIMLRTLVYVVLVDRNQAVGKQAILELS